MSRYSPAHAAPQGVGDARPTAQQVVQDEGLVGALGDKVFVMTGSNSGIGLETARALSTTSAHLFLTVREPEASMNGPLGEVVRSGHVTLVKMDNSSLASIRKAASEILSASKNQVNVLINNAGVMGLPSLELTEDGFETHFATNYLGHFLLFQLLKPAMLASANSSFPSRIVNLSSSAHRPATLSSSDNYNFEKDAYNSMTAYGNSKLAMVYMANEVDRRYGAKGLHANSVHPGGIATNISRHVGEAFVKQITSDESIRKILKSAEQGAATTVLAAVGKEWANRGGKYLEDCEEAKRGEDDGNVFGVGSVRQTFDPKEEARLWKDSLAMIGLPNDL